MRLLLLLAVVSCNEPEPGVPPDAPSGPPDAHPCAFDLGDAFEDQRYVLIQPLDDTQPAIRADGLELWFSRRRLESNTLTHDLRRATRPTGSHRFGQDIPPPFVDDSADERSPSLTEDGLRLFFVSSRNGIKSAVYETSRPSLNDAFGPAIRKTEIAPGVDSIDVTGDGRTIYVSRATVTSATRSDIDQPFGAETVVSTHTGFQISISSDERELFFIGDRVGYTTIERSVRVSTTEMFDCRSSVVYAAASAPDISPSGHELYFALNGEIRVTSRQRLPDLSK